MDVREKLVELLSYFADGYSVENRHIVGGQKVCEIADHLIVNGVTVHDNTEITDELLKQLRNAPLTVLHEEPTIEVVQEWISVKDRLPVDWCPVLVMVRENEKPLLGSYRENVWFHEMWNTTFINGAVTHWMPLPQPPKGE